MPGSGVGAFTPTSSFGLPLHSGCRLAAAQLGGDTMPTDEWTAHAHASQSAARGHAPAGREVLAWTLLELYAQGAVLFSMGFLF
jgi:hypothetical protein